MIRKSLFLLVALTLLATPTFAASKARVQTDATRLASMLQDVQNKSTVSEAMWKTIANEANSLSNRIYGYTSGTTAARKLVRDLRTHVRAMRTSALAGNADDARMHASQALPIAYKLIDWSK